MACDVLGLLFWSRGSSSSVRDGGLGLMGLCTLVALNSSLLVDKT